MVVAPCSTLRLISDEENLEMMPSRASNAPHAKLTDPPHPACSALGSQLVPSDLPHATSTTVRIALCSKPREMKPWPAFATLLRGISTAHRHRELATD